MARAKKTDEVKDEAVEAVEPEAAEAVEANAEATEAEPETAATEDAEANGGASTEAEAEEEESEDSLTFSNGVIEKIVAMAVREVPGVLGMKGGFVNRIQETFGATVATKGVTVEVGDDNLMRINISVIIEYGAYAPQVFEDIKKVVVEQVAGMTGLEVGGVNLRIEDVLTAEEYKRLQREEEAEAE